MPIDILPNVSKPYTLPEHEGKEGAPVFHLRSLSSRATLELSSIENEGTAMFVLAVASCVGIDNVTVEGEPLKVEPMPERRVAGVLVPAGGASEAVIDKLPAAWVAQIAAEVTNRHQLTVGDAGN